MIARLATPLFVKGAAVFVGVLLLALSVQTLRLSWEQNAHEATKGREAQCGASLRIQNAAVEQMRREGEAARQVQREALEQARRQGEAERSARERLIRASRQPQGPGCATPPELRELGNSL